VKRSLIALAAGLLFGLGLIASGMTDPSKVLAFLDLAGSWDPSLACVMGAAIAVALLPFARAKTRTQAWSGDAMELPTQRVIDTRLVVGGLLFGAGWGLAGLCPGPALVALAAGVPGVWIFVLAMLAGMALHDMPWRHTP
jgi:uncharacterized membrane protein YedE/YeeE